MKPIRTYIRIISLSLSLFWILFAVLVFGLTNRINFSNILNGYSIAPNAEATNKIIIIILFWLIALITSVVYVVLFKINKVIRNSESEIK